MVNKFCPFRGVACDTNCELCFKVYDEQGNFIGYKCALVVIAETAQDIARVEQMVRGLTDMPKKVLQGLGGKQQVRYKYRR